MHHEVPRRQRPSTQLFEQQSSSRAHSLPEVRHSGLSGAHASPVQRLLQHCASEEQEPSSETHSLREQVVPLQRRLQQSVGLEQASPGAPHVVIEDSQRPVVGLHAREQQSPSAMQSSAYPRQVAPPPVPEPLAPPVLVPPLP